MASAPVMLFSSAKVRLWMCSIHEYQLQDASTIGDGEEPPGRVRVHSTSREDERRVCALFFLSEIRADRLTFFRS